MERGDIVKVYEDPITCKEFEGEAYLIDCESVDELTEGWNVIFIGDRATGALYRTINKENH